MGDLEFQCGDDESLICPVDGDVVLANQDFYYRPLTDWGFVVLWVLIPMLFFVWIVVLKACCYRKRTNQFYSKNVFLPVESEEDYLAALPIQAEDVGSKEADSLRGSAVQDYELVGNPEKLQVRQDFVDLLARLHETHADAGASLLRKCSGTGGWGFFQPTSDLAWSGLSFVRKAKRPPPSRWPSTWLNLYLPFYPFCREKLLSGKVTVLHDHCGVVKQGQMMAIMGPSGCGKSSLLDMLAGTLRDASERKVRMSPLHVRLQRRTVILTNTFQGVIMAGDEVLARQTLLDTRMASYVTQEELVSAELTVEEVLQFACTLHFPSDVSYKERHELVDATLAVLGLENVRHNIVGPPGEYNISGGQLRRVAIATEALIKGSRVILMDEPTSGLSGGTLRSSSSFCEISATNSATPSSQPSTSPPRSSCSSSTSFS